MIANNIDYRYIIELKRQVFTSHEMQSATLHEWNTTVSKHKSLFNDEKLEQALLNEIMEDGLIIKTKF